MKRVYLLINVKDGMAEFVLENLKNKTGVLVADIVNRPPDIIMVVQAITQERLTSLTLKALRPVENYILGLQILPTRNSITLPTMATPLTFRNN